MQIKNINLEIYIALDKTIGVVVSVVIVCCGGAAGDCDLIKKQNSYFCYFSVK